MYMEKLGLSALIILLLSCHQIQAQQHQQTKISTSFSSSEVLSSTDSYSPKVGRLGLQFASGLFIGAAGGAIGGLASMAVLAPDGNNSGAGFAQAGAFILGGFAGYTLGTSLGVYIVANSPDYDASFGKIVLGNILGTTAGAGTIALLGSSEKKIGFGLAFALPIIGGMIANSLSIQKRPDNSTALLNISTDKVAVSSPLVQVESIGGNLHPKSINPAPTMELLNISL